jgi:hypothetical protein
MSGLLHAMTVDEWQMRQSNGSALFGCFSGIQKLGGFNHEGLLDENCRGKYREDFRFYNGFRSCDFNCG